MNKEKNPVCCICGKECENKWGNNPYPVVNEEEARCCNECNEKVVVPARIISLIKNKGGK